MNDLKFAIRQLLKDRGIFNFGFLICDLRSGRRHPRCGPTYSQGEHLGASLNFVSHHRFFSLTPKGAPPYGIRKSQI